MPSSMGGTPNTVQTSRAVVCLLSRKSMSFGEKENCCHCKPSSSSSGRPAFCGPEYFCRISSFSRANWTSVRRFSVESAPLRPGGILEQRLVPRAGLVVGVHVHRRDLDRAQAVPVVERVEQPEVLDPRAVGQRVHLPGEAVPV